MLEELSMSAGFTADDYAEEPQPFFWWSLEEAARRSVTQIGASACGATALINAFAALGVSAIPTPEEANAAVGTRLRRLGGGLQDYLSSRSNAGATHVDLLRGCENLSRCNVAARFVPYQDILNGGNGFVSWCHREMSEGTAVILCMNLQREGDISSRDWIPDAWHHQMVFGADLSSASLYLTNPLCCMDEAALGRVLCSQSVLLVRDEDVVEQAQTGMDTSAEDISSISAQWEHLNVGERAVRMISEYDPTSPTHVYLPIPAQYKAGATVLRVRSALMEHIKWCQNKYESLELHYTSHRNWSWVVESVLGDACWEFGTPKQLHSFSRQMPSRAAGIRVKPQYALFRVDLVYSSPDNSIYSAWATSQAMEFLDPKDALYRYLSSRGRSDVMPPTLLVPWDCTTLHQLEIPEVLIPRIGKPVMLKAALGSGGYGLYFIEDIADILPIARNHAVKAGSVDNFIENLRRDYGCVPCWSLQYLVPSIKLNDGRKCQFRSYVVVAGCEMYMYGNIEARIVCWDASVVSQDRLRTDEEAFCAGSTARPYNHGRLKANTERILIDEIAELKAGQEALSECTFKAFRALRPDIESRMEEIVNLDSTSCRLAVAGVDLLLTSDYKAYIVEINNNPAMPGETKKMSRAYRKHLKDLVSDIVKLGLSGSPNHTKFTTLW